MELLPVILMDTILIVETGLRVVWVGLRFLLMTDTHPRLSKLLMTCVAWSCCGSRRRLTIVQSILGHYTVTPAIRIRQRPGHPGSPDVLSANRSLHFGRYSEACNGRVERFLCQVQIYF